MDKDQLLQEQLEEIERFLQMEMTHDERAAFLLRVSVDAHLQDQVNEMQLLYLGVQEASLEHHLNKFHQKIPGTPDENSKPVVKFYALRRLLVAASVVILLGSVAWWVFTQAESNERIFAKFYSPDPGLISAMSTTENYSFDRAMIDYKTGNYAAAIGTWNEIKKNQPNNDTLNYFLGSAFLATNQTRQAIDHLEKVTASSGSSFSNDTYWYLALAWIKEGDVTKAVSLLQLCEHPQKNSLLQRLKK